MKLGSLHRVRLAKPQSVSQIQAVLYRNRNKKNGTVLQINVCLPRYPLKKKCSITKAELDQTQRRTRIKTKSVFLKTLRSRWLRKIKSRAKLIKLKKRCCRVRNFSGANKKKVNRVVTYTFIQITLILKSERGKERNKRKFKVKLPRT